MPALLPASVRDALNPVYRNQYQLARLRIKDVVFLISEASPFEEGHEVRPKHQRFFQNFQVILRQVLDKERSELPRVSAALLYRNG